MLSCGRKTQHRDVMHLYIPGCKRRHDTGVYIYIYIHTYMHIEQCRFSRMSFFFGGASVYRFYELSLLRRPKFSTRVFGHGRDVRTRGGLLFIENYRPPRGKRHVPSCSKVVHNTYYKYKFKEFYDFSNVRRTYFFGAVPNSVRATGENKNPKALIVSGYIYCVVGFQLYVGTAKFELLFITVVNTRIFRQSAPVLRRAR